MTPIDVDLFVTRHLVVLREVGRRIEVWVGDMLAGIEGEEATVKGGSGFLVAIFGT
jgi:hypothetical protein